MNKNAVVGLFARYIVLILLGVPNLFLFYAVFTPLTVYPSFWALHVLYDAVLFPGNVIFFKGYYASIIPACVAGAAYYLLVILNLTTPMAVKTRIKSLIFLLASFLVLNLARIFIFALLFFKGYQYFDLTHTATWYFGSTALVVLIWFANVVIFKIQTIPIYSDMVALFKDIRSRRTP